MPKVGVFAAVFDEKDKILCVKIILRLKPYKMRVFKIGSEK